MQHRGPIAAIAASGPYVATAGYDNQVIVWSADRREALSRGLHDHLVNHCAFNSQGSLLVSASSDYSARVWEVPSMRLRACLLGHSDDVDMAVFSPDDRLIATCALDLTIRIFDLSGTCLSLLSGHTGNIISVAWTRDGKGLVSCGVDGTIREWDATKGCETRCTDLSGVRTDTLVIDADGRIFAGDDDGRIVTIIDGEASFIEAHKAGIKKITYDEVSRRLVSLSYDRSLAIWQVKGTRELVEVSRDIFPALVWARSAALLDSHRIAVGTFGSTYAIYDSLTRTWDLDGIVADPSLNAVTVLDDAVYAIGDAGVLKRNGQEVGKTGSLCNFLLAGAERLYTGGQLGCLFDARTGEVLYQHHSPLNCATSFLRNGISHLAIGAYTGEALIFAEGTGGRLDLVDALPLHDNAIKGLASCKGRLFSVCANTSIAWHDVSDFREVRRVRKAHERIANGCCRIGEGFASIGRDLKLRLWFEDRDDVYQTPHPNSVKCIAASEDGRWLMTGAYTGTVAGFDMASKEFVSFQRLTASGISSLAFEAGKDRFLASAYDGVIYPVARPSTRSQGLMSSLSVRSAA